MSDSTDRRGLETAAGDTAGASVSELKAEIERTQAEISSTVEQLQARLAPSRLVDDVKRAARASISEMSAGVRGAALSASAAAATQARLGTERARVRLRQNPTPLVLAGAGLAAALMHVADQRLRNRHRRVV